MSHSLRRTNLKLGQGAAHIYKSSKKSKGKGNWVVIFEGDKRRIRGFNPTLQGAMALAKRLYDDWCFK